MPLLTNQEHTLVNYALTFLAANIDSTTEEDLWWLAEGESRTVDEAKILAACADVKRKLSRDQNLVPDPRS